MQNLRDKVVLITGGGQGIGREMVNLFAKEGAVVVIIDLQDDNKEEVIGQVNAMGGKGYFYQANVTETETIKTLYETIKREVGEIDILINNAGVVFGGSFKDVPLEKHVLTYQVNIIALVSLTHILLPDLIKRPESHIVNIASASGFIGLPYGSSYASSKWAVIGFSESLRLELKDMGIDNVAVSTICPGYINTGMFQGVGNVVLTPNLKPEAIARLILNAVKKNIPFVTAPFMVKTVPIIKALLPISITDKLFALFGVNTSMASWKGKY